MNWEEYQAAIISKIATKATLYAESYFQQDRDLRHRHQIAAYPSMAAMDRENIEMSDTQETGAIRPITSGLL